MFLIKSEGNDNDQDTGDVGKGDPDGLAESQQSKTATDAVMEETQVSQPKSDIDQTSLDDDGQTLSQVQIQYQNLMELAATMQQSQTSTDEKLATSNEATPMQDGNGRENTENKGGSLPFKKRMATSSSEDEQGGTDEDTDDDDVDDDDVKDEDFHPDDSPGISSKKRNKTWPRRRIAATDDSDDSDPDGLKDVPSDSSESTDDDDDSDAYDENGNPRLISINNPRYRHKGQSRTEGKGDISDSKTKSKGTKSLKIKKTSIKTTKNSKKRRKKNPTRNRLQSQENVAQYFEELKSKEVQKQRETADARKARAMKTSSSYRLNFQKNVLESEEYMSEKKQKREERKEKRQLEQSIKQQLADTKRASAQRRWDEHVRDFVPRRGLKPSSIEKAIWTHKVTGLNKAFPKSQPGTIYGEMTKEEKEIIKEYEATLPEDELNKWKHQNQCVNQVTQLKYDKESKMWWAKIPGEDDPKREFVDKDYPRWWMEENFHSDFIEMTIMKEVWLPVPVGNSSTDDAPRQLLTDIKMQFPQKNKNTCLFSGLASALSYCKRKKEATSLVRRATKVEHLDMDSQIVEVKRFMISYLPSIGQSKSFNIRASNHKRNVLSLEELCANKTPFVTIVIPQMKNGNQNHAFTVVDDLIFDSTQSHAMKLTKESIEWISEITGWEHTPSTKREKLTRVDKEVDNETISIVRKNNLLDLELYNFAQQLFKEKRGMK